jgi:hypothetical protein
MLAAFGSRSALSAVNAPAIRVVIILPAKHMQPRTVDFVKTFVDGYIKTSEPYPIFTVLFRSGLLPDTADSMKAVGACGDLVQHDSSFTFSKPPLNDLKLPYHVFADNQVLRNEVTLPKNLAIATTANSDGTELAASFSPNVSIRQIDQLKVNGEAVPLPNTILLQRIKITGTTLRYEFTNIGASKLYGLVLDFQADSGAPKVDIEVASAISSRPIQRKWLALLVYVCLGLSGCSKDDLGKRAAQPGPQPTQPFPDREVCSTMPAPAGFIRIGSKVAGLAGCPIINPAVANVNVYTDYTDQPQGEKLLVCADAPVPAGWQDISGSYQDPTGCDSLKYQQAPFANVRLIYNPPTGS